MTHPLLESLPDTHRKDFEQHIVQRPYARNNVIFHQGDKAQGLYFIDKGLVQFQIEGSSGKSTFIGIAKENVYLGDCELLANLKHFSVATAFTDCQISFLPTSYFNRAMQDFPSFSRAVAERLAKNLYLLQMVQVVRHQWSVEQNLAGIIAYLVAHFSTHLPDGQYHIDVALSQDQLAHMAGLTRQSIHKPLQHWKEQGWIDYHYSNMVVVDLDPFIKIMDDTPHLL